MTIEGFIIGTPRRSRTGDRRPRLSFDVRSGNDKVRVKLRGETARAAAAQLRHGMAVKVSGKVRMRAFVVETAEATFPAPASTPARGRIEWELPAT